MGGMGGTSGSNAPLAGTRAPRFLTDSAFLFSFLPFCFQHMNPQCLQKQNKSIPFFPPGSPSLFSLSSLSAYCTALLHSILPPHPLSSVVSSPLCVPVFLLCRLKPQPCRNIIRFLWQFTLPSPIFLLFFFNPHAHSRTCIFYSFG